MEKWLDVPEKKKNFLRLLGRKMYFGYLLDFVSLSVWCDCNASQVGSPYLTEHFALLKSWNNWPRIYIYVTLTFHFKHISRLETITVDMIGLKYFDSFNNTSFVHRFLSIYQNSSTKIYIFNNLHLISTNSICFLNIMQNVSTASISPINFII